MYSKIKKTAIALCFFLGTCATNHAATYRKTINLIRKHCTLQLKRGKARVEQHYYHSSSVRRLLWRKKYATQGRYLIVLHAKKPYTDIPFPVYTKGLLSTVHTKDSGRSRMHLKYKLGIGAGIASIVAAQLYLNRAEATGYRGKGYRPYDCRWRQEFKDQAEEALANADLFKRLYVTGKLDKKNIDILGTSVLVALLWAQDQGEHLITKHYVDYFCWLMRSNTCSYYTNNVRARKKYYSKLTREINIIRDLLGVPHPIGWEDQVGHFLYGGAKAGALVVTVDAIVAAVPGLNVVALGIGAVYSVYKGVEWIDKNIVYPKKGLAEEEEYIKQELFVRALCADEYSIKQAQGWGSFVVTSVLIADGVVDGLGNLLGEAEALEALEAAEALEGLEALEALEAVEAVEVLQGGLEAAKNDVVRALKDEGKDVIVKEIEKR